MRMSCQKGEGGLLRVFAIRKEERWIACAALLFFVLLNALMVWRYYGQFTPLSKDYWNLFILGFRVSGFDPITYYVVSDWEARYNVYRHPLLAFFMYPLYLLNQGLMWLTGINCVQFVVGALLVFSAFYSFIFLYRILRELVELKRIDACLLTAFFFSFAYILLSTMVPDHFVVSMMLLLLTLYVAGTSIKEHREMGVVETVMLFVATAGVSLNNGLKIFLASLFTNGKRFFMPKHLLLAVILPAALMWGFSRFEYRQFVWEGEQARHELKAKQRKALETRQKAMRKMQEKAREDTAKIQNQPVETAKKEAPAPQKPKSKAPAQPKKKRQIQGTPLMEGEFMRWTDVTTSRWSSITENLFGESVQLHPDYLLQDVFRTRPIIVPYSNTYPYFVEAFIVFLFVAGLWLGCRQRFLWMVFSWFLLDMGLHVGLGFGINEVYIMSAHWMFIIPIAIGFLVNRLHHSMLPYMRGLLLVLTLYLLMYNGWLIGKFLWV